MLKVVLSELDGDEAICIQLLKLSEDNWNDPEQLVFEVLVVTEAALIDSEKVMEILSVIAIDLSLSAGEVEDKVGAVVSIVKEVTDSALLGLFAVSVTLMVQLP